MKHTKYILFSLAVLFLGLMASCNDSESYSDLLRDEEKAVNWYLAQQRVEVSIPADSVFEVGPDAPFYRMDEDGYLYMQVISTGDMKDRPEDGDKVYFRYKRKNIKLMYEGIAQEWSGNMDDLTAGGFTAFFKGNTSYPSSTQFGTGIQVPMDYFGYFSEVNLVIRSYQGFLNDQSQCIPYIVNVKYYRGEY